MPNLDEFGLIAELFAPLAESLPGALSLKDDAALIDNTPGRQMVATVDAMVAGVHFLPDDPPDLIARKLLRVNLSDLAAMGATPRALLLACAFPKGTKYNWIKSFAAGLKHDVEEFGVPVAGGDTVSTPGPLTLSCTALGEVPQGAALLRSGARIGDSIFVTGTIGDGALGLAAARNALPGLAKEHFDFLADRYRLPRPRIALAPYLIGRVHGAMDVSDGLVQDLGHMAAASGVKIVIETGLVPLSQAAQACIAADPARLSDVMCGGDDYELILAAPEGSLDDLPVTRIGRVEPGQGVFVLDEAGAPLGFTRPGYRHFGESS